MSSVGRASTDIATMMTAVNKAAETQNNATERSFTVGGVSSIQLVPREVTTQRDATFLERWNGGPYVYGKHQIGHDLYLNGTQVAFVCNGQEGPFVAMASAVAALGKPTTLKIDWTIRRHDPRIAEMAIT